MTGLSVRRFVNQILERAGGLIDRSRLYEGGI